jgi:hypothetical protein
MAMASISYERIDPMAHRTHFIDHSLLYVCSASIEFSLAIEQIGLVAQGARVNVLCVAESSRVFNILRNRSLDGAGFEAVTGTLLTGEDVGLLREDDVAIPSVRVAIRTDDGAVIEAQYMGVLPLGVGSFRGIVAGAEPLGTLDEPGLFTIIVTPRYETADPRYRWLTEQQCIGFGQVEASIGLFRRVSYDVYALT